METLDIVLTIITIVGVGGACAWVWKQEDVLQAEFDELVSESLDKYYLSGGYEIGSWMEKENDEG